MSKRILFAILCFFSFFFVFICAKASDEKIAPYDSGYKNFLKKNYVINYGGVDLDNVEVAMKELDKTLKENDIHYIMNVGFSGSLGTYRFSDIIIYEFSSNSVEFDIVNTSTSSYNLNFKMNTSGNRATISAQKVYSKYGRDGKVSSIINNLIDYIKEHKHLPSASSDLELVDIYNSSQAFATVVYESGINFSMIYSSNMSMKIAKMQGLDGLKIGDSIYRANSLMPTYMNTPGYGKVYYSFTENINTLGKSQVRFKFDVPKNEMFSFEFNYSVTYPDTYKKIAPFIEYTILDDRLILHKYQLPLENVDISLGNAIYNGTEINSFGSDTQSLEFVVELEKYKDLEKNVLIHFDSEYSFTYEYITENYYQEIDWTNKYGIYLIPKVYNQDNLYESSVYSTIYFKGERFNLGVFSSTDFDVKPTFYMTNIVHKEFMPFSHYFDSKNKSSVLFFTDDDYLARETKQILKFDTRYFSYSLCSSPNLCDVVLNPNTNEEITIKPPVIKEEEEKNEVDRIIDRILDPIKSKLPILDQIPDVWGVFLISIKEPKPPEWIIDLNPIGFDTRVKMDFSIFDKYRETIFFVIKLSATYVTLKKLLDILLKYFND